MPQIVSRSALTLQYFGSILELLSENTENSDSENKTNEIVPGQKYAVPCLLCPGKNLISISSGHYFNLRRPLERKQVPEVQVHTLKVP